MQAILLSVMLLLVPTTRAARPIPKPQNASVAADAPSRICLDAAKNALGPRAAVLACGHLTGAAALEVVAALRLKKFRTNADGIPVSKFVVLRRAGSRWSAELTADRNWIRNGIGYLSDEASDPRAFLGSLPSFSAHFTGYRVSFSGRNSDDALVFTIWVYVLSPAGADEGIPYEVCWNPKEGRFQAFSYGHDPEGFQPEVKATLPVPTGGHRD